MHKSGFKRQLIYYYGTFFVVLMVVTGYSLWQVRAQGTPFIENFQQVWFLPVLVFILQFSYDLFHKVLKKRVIPKSSGETYIQHISHAAKESLQLETSDFENLRNNHNFQRALGEIYQRYLDKNKNEEDYRIILEKLEKGTLEHSIIELAIKESIILLQEESN